MGWTRGRQSSHSVTFAHAHQGWDKTYCLQFLEKDNFKTIHFFGDKTYQVPFVATHMRERACLCANNALDTEQGGNDYEIFASEKTEGHTTTGPEETMKMCQDLFLA